MENLNHESSVDDVKILASLSRADLSDYINEELDDNIFWKIDTYFQNNPDELKSFNGMIDVCRSNKSFNVSTIEAYLNSNELLSKNQKKFVDFLDNTIKQDTTINKDYNSSIYNIVKTVIGNKTEGTKYTNS